MKKHSKTEDQARTFADLDRIAEQMRADGTMPTFAELAAALVAVAEEAKAKRRRRPAGAPQAEGRVNLDLLTYRPRSCGL